MKSITIKMPFVQLMQTLYVIFMYLISDKFSLGCRENPHAEAFPGSRKKESKNYVWRLNGKVL